MKSIISILVFLLPLSIQAFIPASTIPTNNTLKSSDLDFFKKLLEQGKMINAMECEIKTRSTQAVRKFKDRSTWVETLEVAYRPYRHSSDLAAKIVISPGAKYGSRESADPEHGPIEEFRIELDNIHYSFIEFSHDGRGNITNFNYGDIYRIYPCRLKRYP